jgi:putative SOS response-associated peptidase YedK
VNHRNRMSARRLLHSSSMCGRYRLTAKQRYMRDHFGLDEDPPWEPHWNIAPTQQIATIRQHPAEPVRIFGLMRWGLIPYWAKDQSFGSRAINAMSETAAEKPAFRDAIKRRRCLIPADGFYEWVRHEVACVTVRRALPDRTCHPIGSTLRGMAFRKRIV